MSVQAHEDDDILFMNPDVDRDVLAGRCVLSVYVTAGDANFGTGYWQGREDGARAAYANMAGVANAWVRSTVTVSGHSLTFSTLTAKPEVRLLFMRLPDGNLDGSGFSNNNFESLQKLWTGGIQVIHAVDGSTAYSQPDLISTIVGIMTIYQPDVIRTQDYVNSFGGGDHSDHYTAAQFALAAHRQYTSAHTIRSYMGYPISNLPVNLSSADTATKQSAFLAYASGDPLVCQTAADCQNSSYGNWFARQYTTGSEVGGSGNISPAATITASSENLSTNQPATNVVDGYVAGWPHDYTKEWTTIGGKAGSWIKLAWPSRHTLNRIVLYDRPNTDDQVTAGTLTFSDGTSLPVDSLPNDGSAKIVNFNSKSIDSVTFTVTGVSAATQNIGLAELQAYEINVAPLATITASSQDTTTGQLAGKATDGYAVGWPNDYTREWATIGGKAGSWLQLEWSAPQTINRVVLFDRPNLDDQITAATITFSDGSSVDVPSLPNNGSPQVINFPTRTITALRLSISSVSATTFNIGLAELQADFF